MIILAKITEKIRNLYYHMEIGHQNYIMVIYINLQIFMVFINFLYIFLLLL